MADWDQNSPEDSDIVSQYPANARAARAAVRTNFGVDHREQNDADVGKHEVIQMVAQGAAPTIAAGQVGIWNEGGVLKTRVGTGSITDLGIESGTRMLFHQAAAPTGWTQDATVNDRVLRVVSGAGGGTGGSWTISGLTVNGHALTVAQMPSHAHTGSTNTTGSHSHTGSTNTTGSHDHNLIVTQTGSGSGLGLDRTSSTNTTTSSANVNNAGSHSHSLSINNAGNHTHTVSIGGTGGGNAHSHGLTANGNWRPSYTDVIVAEKD